MLTVGDRAPDFSLAPEPGPDRVTLSEHRGKPVLLMFVPFAFSSTCTEEFCHLREEWSVWGDLGVEIFGISIDSPFANQRWREETGAPFPILSDFNKDTATAYGVLYEEILGFRGVAKRSVFLIDGAGRVAFAWANDDASVLPPFDDILEAVEAVGREA